MFYKKKSFIFVPENSPKLHIQNISIGNSFECSLMNVCGGEHHQHDFQCFCMLYELNEVLT